jgi:hypothetical protein
LRDGLLRLVPTFHCHRRKENQNRGGSEANA